MTSRPTRRAALAALHATLQPRNYLEIGVDRGRSLRLANCPAIGVDPHPRVRDLPANAALFVGTSDEFFADHAASIVAAGPFDLVYIDGLHLIEQTLRDFANAEQVCHPGSVIAVDDVTPGPGVSRSRTPTSGMWAGDVWKLPAMLAAHRPDLDLELLDVAPAGLLLVRGLNPYRGTAWVDEVPTP
jgi:predicted O-methyltransferase YrrM